MLPSPNKFSEITIKCVDRTVSGEVINKNMSTISNNNLKIQGN